MLGNCDIWAMVDFGKGEVEIRCTEVGEHDQHRCEVAIIVEPDAQDLVDDMPIHNIFQNKAS